MGLASWGQAQRLIQGNPTRASPTGRFALAVPGTLRACGSGIESLENLGNTHCHPSLGSPDSDCVCLCVCAHLHLCGCECHIAHACIGSLPVTTHHHDSASTTKQNIRSPPTQRPTPPNLLASTPLPLQPCCPRQRQRASQPSLRTNSPRELRRFLASPPHPTCRDLASSLAPPRPRQGSIA